MVLAEDLKRIINQIPDKVPVSLGDSYDCDITGFSFDTSEGVAKLHMTEGFGIVKNEFVDSLFDSIKKAYEARR